MTSAENPLYGGILDDAKAKAALKIKAAQSEADEIIAEAHVKAETIAEAEKRGTSIRLESIRLKEESAKRNIDRIIALRSMDEGYEAIMKRVGEKLEALYADKEKSREILIRWIAEAGVGLGLEEAMVSSSPKNPVDVSMLKAAEVLIKSKTGAAISLSLDDRPCSEFGVVLSSLDGKISYNNQIDTRMRRMARNVKSIVQELTCKVE